MVALVPRNIRIPEDLDERLEKFYAERRRLATDATWTGTALMVLKRGLDMAVLLRDWEEESRNSMKEAKQKARDFQAEGNLEQANYWMGIEAEANRTLERFRSDHQKYNI